MNPSNHELTFLPISICEPNTTSKQDTTQQQWSKQETKLTISRSTLKNISETSTFMCLTNNLNHLTLLPSKCELLLSFFLTVFWFCFDSFIQSHQKLHNNRAARNKETLMRELPTVQAACGALLSLISSLQQGELVTNDFSEFLDTHLPVAFKVKELLQRVPDPHAQHIWVRLIDHLCAISSSFSSSSSPSSSSSSETKQNVMMMDRVCSCFGQSLVEVAPKEWARQEAFRLYVGLVEFLRVSQNAKDNLAPLERVLVGSTDHVLAKALCAHYNQENKKEMGLIARSLVRVYNANGKCLSLLKEFVGKDIQEAENPINVLAQDIWTTLVFKEYTSLLGKQYQQDVFQPVVRRIYKSRNKLEVDSQKLKESYEGFDDEEMAGFLHTNQKELQALTQLAIDYIVTSVSSCPPGIRLLTKYIQECLMKRFDQSERVKYRVMSSLLFTLFFCDALAGMPPPPRDPKDKDDPDEAAQAFRDGVATISKVLQHTAGGQPAFESRLQFLTPWIGEHIPVFNALLDAWVDVEWPVDGNDPPLAVRGNVDADLRVLAEHFRRHVANLEILTKEKIRAQQKLSVLMEMMCKEKLISSSSSSTSQIGDDGLQMMSPVELSSPSSLRCSKVMTKKKSQTSSKETSLQGKQTKNLFDEDEDESGKL